LQQIIFKAQDDFQLLVTSRISKHVADEAEKVKAIKEQAEADARAKIEAEAKAKEAAEIKAREELEAKIIAEANAIPDGDAITNETINQADFNKVFEVKEQPTAQVGSVRPTAQSIINLVAKTYNVDTATANRWLAQSFGELKAA
jgi:membrane protein involved in colicin uptake